MAADRLSGAGPGSGILSSGGVRLSRPPSHSIRTEVSDDAICWLPRPMRAGHGPAGPDRRVDPVKLVGLSGGIGCGKSTVAERLRRLGADTIDVDLLNRELQQP
ncbi:MAG: dephospho-CoA kinase, partial [Acidimicrobiia bacterium]